MSVPYSVIFAYNTENSLDTATIATYTIAWAKATTVINSIYHTLVDFVTIRDSVSKIKRLEFKIGRPILSTAAGRSFFNAFFTAPYKWAVYGDFKDIGNYDYSNLCLCEPPSDFNQASGQSGNIVDVSIAQDANGYILLSSGVTLMDGSSEGGESGGSSSVILADGNATLDGSGTVTVANANISTIEKIFLSRQAGKSNMAIYVSAVIEGVSFTITSAAGADDAGLIIGWITL